MGHNLEELESIHHLARYAALAYSDADGAEFRMHAPELRGPTVSRKLESKGPSYLTQNTRIHLGIRDEQTVVVVFSGYDSPWLYEDYLVRPLSLYGLLCYVAMDVRFSLRRVDWGDGPRDAWVHEHYLLTFNKLRDDLLKHIRNLLEWEGTKRADVTKIQVCGHGLGGALATLCALWCAIQWKDAKITCVTLGSPKVGDDSFADEFGRRGIDCYRLVIESDPFAAMPYVHRYRGTPAWQHVGKEIRLPRYQEDVKSFRNLGQASDISGRLLEFHIGESVNNVMEPIVVYFGVSFGLWIGYWLLKFNQLWLNVSVHSPMAYMTSLQGVIEHDLSTEEDAASGSDEPQAVEAPETMVNIIHDGVLRLVGYANWAYCDGAKFRCFARDLKRQPLVARERFPRISLPVELMRDSYDVVVIGTGYGGGVAASRMARGKQKVCVLERGKERWPGEYPETLPDAAKELRVSGDFAPGDRRSIPGTLVEGGNPTGLYHFFVGEGQNVYMANGLGGTSLVNANAYLEVTPAVLEMDIWPKELRGMDAWKKYYDRAAEVLEPTPYPTTFPELLKANLLKKQASLMGCEDKFYRVRQTTRFQDGPNSTGVYMRASRLTGMDATGINDGSKSTTLVNYLSDAWNWGAEMFCECEVRYVTKAPGREGYIIWFAWHSSKRGRFKTLYDDLMWVHAKKMVFFGAGSLGTTEILLRSKELGLSMSDELGTEMSGNGDMLGFGYNTDYPANCMAHPGPPNDRPIGPCITSVLDLRDMKNPLEGFVVEDCAIPLALGPFVLPMLTYVPDEVGPTYNAVRRASKAAARLGSKKFGPYFPEDSVSRTPAYLIMSHDSSQGRLSLTKDKPVLIYSGVGRSESVSRIHAFLEAMTEVVGGNFIANPAWTLLGAQEITVHPIGGARVSSDGTGHKGVVNSMGEIFSGNGTETHSGLIVCDGAAVPAAVGVNPFATITALAERSVELAAKKYGIGIDYETKNGDLDMFGKPAHPQPRNPDLEKLATTIAKADENGYAGIGFSEIMSGFIHAGGDIADFDIAAKLARSRSESAHFFITVKSWDTDELVNNARHPANLTGTFCCEALGGVFLVHRGTFQFFSQDPRAPDTANLVYNFDMVSPKGTKLHFNGYKVVNSSSFLNPLEVWRQTSTLYVTITNTDAEVVGRGTLRIQPRDFIQELQTFEPSGPTAWSRATSTAQFLLYFTRQLAVPFLSSLGRLQWPSERVNTTTRATAPSQTIQLVATDGENATLHMWNPIKDGEDLSARAPTILFVPGAAVDHTMFALPTIEKNAITYFREAGYRAYCLTHRVGRTPIAQKNYTPYDARRDIHAALVYVRKASAGRGQEDNPKVYVIAHGAGSLALSSGLLDGTIPGEWLSGITASMVFMNPKFGKVDHVLSQFPVSAYEKLVGSWWDCCSSPDDSYVQQLLNQVLRFYSARTGETCRSVVCHRSALVFGRLWTHQNLNEATHRHLDRFLGGTSMRSLGWLLNASRVERVTTNSGVELVTPENIDRLKGIPILFLSGTGNMVFAAENTDTSFTTLCNAHGRQWYEREVFTGKGHLDAWMGPNAYQDVYPRVKRHVDAITQGK